MVAKKNTRQKKSLGKKEFTLDSNTGIMRNPADLSRNVSFKAVTFCAILENICSEAVNSLEQKMGDILYSAGYSAGSKFGEALSRKLNKVKPPISVEDKIEKWCSFDSNVGWGRFEDNLEVNETRETVSGKIVLENNFLTADRKRKDFNICSLMTGYIAGVLEKLLGFQVHVIHDKSYCGQFKSDKDSCEFFVSSGATPLKRKRL